MHFSVKISTLKKQSKNGNAEERPDAGCEYTSPQPRAGEF